VTDSLFKLTIDLRNKIICKEQFNALAGNTGDDRAFALSILADAISKRDSLNLAAGLSLAFEFGFSAEHLGLLISLVDADWHHSHEDVVWALDKLGDLKSVDALFKATQIVPQYLAYDDTRALASKAIWALGNLNDKIADEKLRLLAESDCEVIKEDALEQLERRASPGLAR